LPTGKVAAHVARATKFSPEQQRLTLPPKGGARSGVALAKNDTLQSYGLSDGSIIYLKNLGQASSVFAHY
jgi:hypothetical protein